ncbi:MAG: hypothetical protein UV38_C0002G0228 [candidate division TM6 bacterium GW2011_GWE2_42_60]|nr:MAG: hypothetical protein UV38_C0002G0228 [candidate division TM6 bacterium GW2011_GWE2_42_60]HBY06020.1 hypothetical protein [Candidatus Dependentiae bacterium]
MEKQTLSEEKAFIAEVRENVAQILNPEKASDWSPYHLLVAEKAITHALSLSEEPFDHTDLRLVTLESTLAFTKKNPDKATSDLFEALLVTFLEIVEFSFLIEDERISEAIEQRIESVINQVKAQNEEAGKQFTETLAEALENDDEDEDGCCCSDKCSDCMD